MGVVLSKILAGLGGNLVENIGKIIDNLSTSKEEKLLIAAELKKAEIEFQLRAKEISNDFEKEITKRHESDSKSDSWLPKNIRPLTLITTLGLFTALSMFSGFFKEFDVPIEFVETIKIWGMMAFGFYFSSRGIEKIASIIKGNKKDA